VNKLKSEVFIIGTGKAAFTFVKALLEARIIVSGVYGRSKTKLLEFSNFFQIPFFENLNDIPKNASLYLIAISDRAIKEVSNNIDVEGLVAHCAGITDIEILSKHSNRAVIWPAQSMSKQTSLKNSPLCIEASTHESMQLIKQIAGQISDLVYEVNSHERQILHLGAAFGNNFVNHLYAITNRIVSRNGLDFNILKPLIVHTAEKILNALPEDLQTGPAIRNDESSIKKHLDLLGEDENLLNIYKLITANIQQFKKDESVK